MDIVVELWSRKSLGVECNWVQLAIHGCNRKDCSCSEYIIRCISLDCNLSIQHPMGKDQSCGESLFKCFKGRMALIGEMPNGTLVGKTHKWNILYRLCTNGLFTHADKCKFHVTS